MSNKNQNKFDKTIPPIVNQINFGRKGLYVMLNWIFYLEIRTTGGEDHFVGSEELSFHRQGDVHERLIM